MPEAIGDVPAQAPGAPGATSMLSGFGRTRAVAMRVAEVTPELVATREGITRGAGCGYGDQALVSGGSGWRAPDGIDVDGDEVVVGGGAVLRDIVATLWPRGRTLPVLPGSLAVTVGGAIAADAHGKNHPAVGSIGQHVASLHLLAPTGRHRVTPGDDAFRATVGGMGLTGTITQARLATAPLDTAWVTHRRRRVTGDDALLDVLAASAERHDHVAAWVDLAGSSPRAVVEVSDPAPIPDGADDPVPVPSAPRLSVPRLPTTAITPFSIRLANEARWRRTTDDAHVVPLVRALAPLETVAHFPRAYGPAGMVQHQVVLPDGAEDLLLDLLARHRTGPVVAALTVLKRLGPTGPGWLSFPLPGWTLAVDLPAGDPALGPVLDAMDADVAAAGGRVYLAKDATMRPEHLTPMYPGLGHWRTAAARLDPDHLVSSDLDRRLGLRRARTARTEPGTTMAARDA